MVPIKAILTQLAPVVTIDKYQIQPPLHYELHTQQGPARSFRTSADAWVGPARANGTHPYVMIGFLTPPVTEVNKYTLNQVFVKMIAGVERRRRNWKQSPFEQGHINGMTFLRTY